uniref:Uncharacterized protein n=1 Tax=Arundo donax TaxID=35708 RepID=A0A0A9AY99_ARUDO
MVGTARCTAGSERWRPNLSGGGRICTLVARAGMARSSEGVRRRVWGGAAASSHAVWRTVRAPRPCRALSGVT